ncbi:MAG: hypothetical protein OHK0052_10420 [Anaerolineales bacterium]
MRDFWLRAAILLGATIAIVLLISESIYLLQRNETERAPQNFEITIPNGTAAKIEAGGPGPYIPQTVFVVGDTLTVHNQDVTDHQLGPVWIPANTSGSLLMEKANNYAYTCSFQSSRYLGLTVRNASGGMGDRLSALWYGVPPLFMFFMVYSYLIRPPKAAGVDDLLPEGGAANSEAQLATSPRQRPLGEGAGAVGESDSQKTAQS